MSSCYKMVFLAGHGGGGGCKTERGSKGPGPALTAEVSAHYIYLLEKEDLGMLLLLCPGNMFRKRNENILAWLWHIQL
jgi:hypothetical protein